MNRRRAGGGRGRTLSVVLAVMALGLLVQLYLRRTGEAPPPGPARPTAADLRAPRRLQAAARRVGFHTSTEPGVGLIESKPASAAGTPPSAGLLAVGSVAPEFRLRTPEGGQVALFGLRGKAVLLEFFATWCPHCQAEAPHLRRLALRLGGAGFAFVSINGDGETAPSVYAFHRYFGLPYPALLDPSSRPGSFHGSGSPGPVSRRYGLSIFPTFYVIDPAGRIAWRGAGELPDAFLLEQLRRARGLPSGA